MFPPFIFGSSALYLILCVAVGVYWHSKGRSWIAGIALSWVLTPIGGGIIGAVLQTNHKKLGHRKSVSNNKICPDCHHLVKPSLVRCNKCHYVFGNELYEELRERLLTIDDIRFEAVNQYGYQTPKLDDKLRKFQYELLEFSDDISTTARQYSNTQLQAILKVFPSRLQIEEATLAQAKMWATSIECPHCHVIQSRENLMCSECYTDLKRLNPDTGEVESIDVDWDDDDKQE
jgi:phosphate/sulfate permease